MPSKVANHEGFSRKKYNAWSKTVGARAGKATLRSSCHQAFSGAQLPYFIRLLSTYVYFSAKESKTHKSKLDNNVKKIG